MICSFSPIHFTLGISMIKKLQTVSKDTVKMVTMEVLWEYASFMYYMDLTYVERQYISA